MYHLINLTSNEIEATRETGTAIGQCRKAARARDERDGVYSNFMVVFAPDLDEDDVLEILHTDPSALRRLEVLND